MSATDRGRSTLVGCQLNAIFDTQHARVGGKSAPPRAVRPPTYGDVRSRDATTLPTLDPQQQIRSGDQYIADAAAGPMRLPDIDIQPAGITEATKICRINLKPMLVFSCGDIELTDVWNETHDYCNRRYADRIHFVDCRNYVFTDNRFSLVVEMVSTPRHSASSSASPR